MAAPKQPQARMSPSDIETYASYVKGVDPARYFSGPEQRSAGGGGTLTRA